MAQLRKLNKIADKYLTIMVVLLAIAPFFVSNYVVTILTLALIYAILAISLDLAWGYGGILSLGQATFFGIGAYTYSIFTLEGDGSVLSIFFGALCGIIFAALFAGLIGLVVFLRQSSDFFVGVITLSLTVLAAQMVLRVPELTGGKNGLTGFSSFSLSGIPLYFILWASLVLVIFAVYKLTKSDFGKLIVAIRDNEERSKFLGYNTSFAKSMVYCFSGAIAGFSGVLYAPVSGFVSPDLIGFALSTAVIVWVAIGGRGHLAGAVLGALLINILTPIFNYDFPYLWQISIGLLFIIVVVFAPNGLIAFVLRKQEVNSDYKIETVVSTNNHMVGQHDLDSLVITDLEVSYGSLNILRGVNLEIRPGELLCIIGPNGAGKSTLINAITGKIQAAKGSIMYQGNELREKKVQEIAKLKIGRKFQSTNVYDTITVAENLQLASSKGNFPTVFKNTSSLQIPSSVETLMKFSGLDQKIGKLASNLSHGEQQWLEICMVMALEPKILLLDEPTAGLIKEERQEVGKLLKKMVAELGVGILIIEHDIEFVKEIADRVTVLYNGKIVADGSVDAITSSSIVKDIYLGVKA